MSINVIITGANGRMGKTLQGVVKQDPALKLVGLVVHESEYAESRKITPCL